MRLALPGTWCCGWANAWLEPGLGKIIEGYNTPAEGNLLRYAQLNSIPLVRSTYSRAPCADTRLCRHVPGLSGGGGAATCLVPAPSGAPVALLLGTRAGR